MNHIFADLWQRLIKEVHITLAGTGEAVLSVSERVNRKTQMLRLHWQAAVLTRQIEKASRTVGHALCDLAVASGDQDTDLIKTHVSASRYLLEGATAVRVLKQELTHVEGSIREIEAEVLLEDLVRVQRDLTSRSVGLSRLIVASDSSAIGLSFAQLNLPVTTHAAALFRGPALLFPTAEVPIRSGDIVILLGPQADLQQAASHFMSQNRGDLRKRERVRESYPSLPRRN